MKSLAESLSNAERLDLASVVERCGARFSFLPALRDFPYGARSLLGHTQAVMDAVLDEPPPSLSPAEDSTMTPWWSPMPAAYVAALFLHVGLPEVCRLRSGGGGRALPHARESAGIARSILRELGVPFVVREHAAALVLHRPKPLSLLSSGAPAETYMRLACSVDLRSLYWLGRAEARASGRDEPAAQKLEAFRQRVEQLHLFGRPQSPPLDAQQVRELGFDDVAEQHRALNALRYFRLVSRMDEQQWYVERLCQECAGPRGRLHLLVGPAGSGKSSWASEQLAHTYIVSSDRMREELTGDPADQGQNYLVFQRCMDRIRRLLREGREVTFDATNYSETLRAMPVQAARWSGAQIVSYFFDVGLGRALSRDRTRRRRVPEHVIRRHHRLLEPPALYEADRHIVVDADGRTEQYWPVVPQELLNGEELSNNIVDGL